MILQTQPFKLFPFTPTTTQKQPNSILSPKPIFPKCSSLSVTTSPDQTTTHVELQQTKPYPAEVSRTIMELSSSGTLSTLTHDGWPLGFGVKFTVDHQGTPVLGLNFSDRKFSIDKRSSLHVKLKQCGIRTPQCTIQGSVDKPEDKESLKKLHSIWKKRFGEEISEDLLYVVSVDRVLQLEDYQEDGIWVTSSDYKNACPDPLKDVAENIVNEINTNNMEDVLRFCNVYADLQFHVSKAKMVWIDRLGFDMWLYSPLRGVFEVRIPFPREVTDEKGVKSTFNGMSQTAWEVEKHYYAPDFQRVKQVKKLAVSGL